MSDSDDESDPPHSATAVKSDFSVITQTIDRQLQTFASFLAPPPQQRYSPSSTSPVPLPSGDVSPSSYEGLKNDLAEIGDRFRTGLSLLSPKKAVTQISKLASNLLQFDKGDDFDVVGITDDVVDFVEEISTRPECWVDFPLSLQNKDFNMSHVHKDHALAIQELVPNLTTLRRALHNHMSEQHFWMIYFILLLPRLNEDDSRLLSTPEIVQARDIVLRKLRNKNTPGEKGKMGNSTEQSENPFQEIEPLGATDNATNRFSSASENSDWVRLSGSSKASHSMCRERRSGSEGSSSDWHAVEDVDL